MLNGLFITAHTATSDKFIKLYTEIENSAQQHKNISLKRITNFELSLRLTDSTLLENIDFVLFWTKDVELAKIIESKGIRVFNSSKAIRICDNKATTYSYLYNKVPQPKTIIVPYLYGFPFDWKQDTRFTNQAIKNLGGYPLIVKEAYGSFGQQVYLAKNEYTLIDLLTNLNSSKTNPVILQEFMKTSKNKEHTFMRDIRAYMIGNKCVSAIQRLSPEDKFTTQDVLREPFELNEEQLKVCQTIMKEIELDFAGIDLLFGENDLPVVCEVNSNAHFINLKNTTGVNPMLHLFDYIEQQMLK